jgi:uncharacterized membrane protein (UPF0127 family)
VTQHARLVESGSGRELLTQLRLAVNPWTRFRGLLGTPRLSLEQGLWLEPCNSVHMIGMTYPIDVVYLDKEGTVIRILPHLRPWHLGPIVWGARAVVELADGAIKRLDIRLGRRLHHEAPAAQPA